MRSRLLWLRPLSQELQRLPPPPQVTTALRLPRPLLLLALCVPYAFRSSPRQAPTLLTPTCSIAPLSVGAGAARAAVLAVRSIQIVLLVLAAAVAGIQGLLCRRQPLARPRPLLSGQAA